MAMLRSRRLEGLLGGSLDAVTAASVRGLVEGGVAEAFDLDFKSTHYGRGDSEKRDLAGDVAALANTAGGLIVIGVEEDAQARAVSAPGVPTSDAEVARIRLVVASSVSPLPAFDVELVPDTADGEHGFVLIGVPRSAIAPHAVLVNDALRFPTRNGSTTRYLSEPEVAAAYRTRLLGASDRRGRLDQVVTEIASRLRFNDATWVMVALLPELPGDLQLTRSVFTQFEDATRATRIGALWGTGGDRFARAQVGHQRLRADDTQYGDEQEPPYGAATELHTDGAGVVARRVFDDRGRAADPTVQVFADEQLAEVIAWSLRYLAQHAHERAHAGGMAEVCVQLRTADTVTSSLIGNWRTGSPAVAGRRLTSIPAVSTYAQISDLVDGGVGLTAATARLHHAIGHAFGYPELPQFTIDGEIAWPFWQGARRLELQPWAQEQGVPIVGGP